MVRTCGCRAAGKGRALRKIDSRGANPSYRRKSMRPLGQLNGNPHRATGLYVTALREPFPATEKRGFGGPIELPVPFGGIRIMFWPALLWSCRWANRHARTEHARGPCACMRQLPRQTGRRHARRLLPPTGGKTGRLSLQSARGLSGRLAQIPASELSAEISAQRLSPRLGRVLRRATSGERRNDPGGLMRNIACKMTPDEIEQAAEYYSSQPAFTAATK